jgi:predicted Zn-dependent protease
MAARPPVGGAPAASAAKSTTPPAGGGSGKAIVIGAVLVVAAAAGYFMFAGKKEAQVAQVSPQAASSSQALTSKDHLNELLGLSRDGRWKEIPAKAQLIKSMSQIDGGNNKESAELSASAEQASSSGDWANATASFERAIALDPGNVDARFGLGLVLTRQGKFEQAKNVLVDGLLISPDKGRGWLTAAEAFAELGKDEAAASSLKLAVYYSKNREAALNALKDENVIKSSKLRSLIQANMPSISGVPVRN